MTKKDLEGLTYIVDEIKTLQKEIKELESLSLIRGQNITGLPSASGSSGKDRVADRAIQRQELQELLDIAIKRLMHKRTQIERCISAIENDRERLIVRLRCINHLSWEEIGFELGYHRTNVQKIYQKTVEKICKDSHNSH